MMQVGAVVPLVEFRCNIAFYRKQIFLIFFSIYEYDV